MLITFKSRASSDVMMFEQSGREMLSLLGKSSDDNAGIVTVDQLSAAIAAVKKAIENDQIKNANPTGRVTESGNDSADGVHVFQRGQPMLELLERSLKDGSPVTWGT